MSNSRPRNSRSGQAGAMLPAWPRALVVIAHPDDESFGLGAVVDQLTVAGAAVHIVCYTHGGASTLNHRALRSYPVADFADLEAARHHRRVVILDVRAASAEVSRAQRGDHADQVVAAIPEENRYACP